MKKIKINHLPFADMIRFITASNKRINKMKKGPSSPFKENEGMIEGVNKLHPLYQKVIISEISEEGSDTRSYILKSEGEPLAYFLPGQYISVSLKIGDNYLTRPYSISSSPEEALKGFYRMTVKRVKNGFASEYILNNWKEGDKLIISAPLGHFTYSSLRDKKTLVCLAGGSGITPFISMAKAVKEGTLNVSLILLYGSRNEKEILFKKELDELEKCEKIHVIHVLSEENNDKYEQGFISADLIKKYAPESYSVFVCGPQAMYDYLKNELTKLNLSPGRIRYETMSSPLNLNDIPGYPEELTGKTYSLTVHQKNMVKTIAAEYNDTILVSLEKNGFAVPSHCRGGECGYCHSKCLKGSLFIPEEKDYLRRGDKEYNCFHPCSAYALTDLEIEIPSIPE